MVEAALVAAAERRRGAAHLCAPELDQLRAAAAARPQHAWAGQACAAKAPRARSHAMAGVSRRRGARRVHLSDGPARHGQVAPATHDRKLPRRALRFAHRVHGRRGREDWRANAALGLLPGP